MASTPLPWLGLQGEEGLGTIGAGRMLAASLPATSRGSGSRSVLFHVPRVDRLAGLVLPSENRLLSGCGLLQGVWGTGGGGPPAPGWTQLDGVPGPPPQGS